MAIYSNRFSSQKKKGKKAQKLKLKLQKTVKQVKAYISVSTTQVCFYRLTDFQSKALEKT